MQTIPKIYSLQVVCIRVGEGHGGIVAHRIICRFQPQLQPQLLQPHSVGAFSSHSTGALQLHSFAAKTPLPNSLLPSYSPPPDTVCGIPSVCARHSVMTLHATVATDVSPPFVSCSTRLRNCSVFSSIGHKGCTANPKDKRWGPEQKVTSQERPGTFKYFIQGEGQAIAWEKAALKGLCRGS